MKRYSMHDHWPKSKQRQNMKYTRTERQRIALINGREETTTTETKRTNMKEKNEKEKKKESLDRRRSSANVRANAS